MKKEQSVGALPMLPYSCMAANCMLWTTYGVLKREFSIWVPNAAGLVMALYYIMSYLQLLPNKGLQKLPGTIKAQVRGVAAVVLASLVATSFKVPASVIGTTAVIFCIMLFASPLATLKTVLQTRNASSIPLPFTVVSILNCFFWTVSGLLKLHDMNIIVPNFLGLSFGLFQAALKIVYGNGDQRQYGFATP
jgi:solute carrier family 50 protein (sugar transporter)